MTEPLDPEEQEESKKEKGKGIEGCRKKTHRLQVDPGQVELSPYSFHLSNPLRSTQVYRQMARG
jgi:hypothetical protein